jgi:hypothetical protein
MEFTNNASQYFPWICIELFMLRWRARIRRLAESKAEAFKQKTFDKAVEMRSERVKKVQAAR